MFGGTASVCVFSDKRGMVLGSQALLGNRYKNVCTPVASSTELLKGG